MELDIYFIEYSLLSILVRNVADHERGALIRATDDAIEIKDKIRRIRDVARS